MSSQLKEHLRTTGVALKRWFIAQSYDALAVGLLWFAGLMIIGVPWAPLWAALGGVLQFVPHFGPVTALIGPAIAAALTGGGMRFLYVLLLYAVIVVVDGLVLHPMFMKRTARVPLWASILAPIALGLMFSFWGVLAAGPLLAIVYAFREKAKARAIIPPAPR